ncbi:MAG: hypothetical protein ACXW3C_01470, partial [Pyrinomonadaceae bacterium]
TRKDLFKPAQTMRLGIDTALDDTQGCIKVKRGGRPVNVVFDFADDGSNFYSYVLAQFKQ